MSAHLFDFDDPDTQAEQSDPVWGLLTQSKLPAPEPWFAVRVLARCRAAGLGAESPLRILDRAWRMALGAGLAVCVVFFLVARIHPTAPTPRQSVQEAFEIIASMDNDSSNSSSSSWQDSSL